MVSILASAAAFKNKEDQAGRAQANPSSKGGKCLDITIQEGWLEQTGEDWFEVVRVSKATKKAGAEHVIEGGYKQMEKA